MRRKAYNLGCVTLFALMSLGAVALSIVLGKPHERLLALALGAFLLVGAIYVYITAKAQSQPPTPRLGYEPTTYQPALMFPENPHRLRAAFVMSVLFTLLCILFLAYLYPDLRKEGKKRVRTELAAIASILGIPLFGGASVLLYGRLRNLLPTLTITPAGVQVVLLKRPVRLEWHQIGAVHAYEVKGEAWVVFVLSESTPKPFWERWISQMAVDEGDIAASLASAPEPVVALLEFYRTHPEHRYEIGSPASLERYQALLSGSERLENPKAR
ncbi:MAG: hypothetical protein RMJ83_03575 [Armatimonadota bacterium]|nr:hypothetical protein [Armatimonadota bacterium]